VIKKKKTKRRSNKVQGDPLREKKMQGVKGNSSLTKWSIPCHIPHCY